MSQETFGGEPLDPHAADRRLADKDAEIAELQALLTEACDNEPEAKALVADAQAAEIAALRPVAELLVALPTWTEQTTNELRDNYQRARNIARAALEMIGGVK